MSELAAKTWDLTAPASNQRDALEKELRLLFKGTETFGQTVDSDTVDTWTLALKDSGITLAQFQMAVSHWIKRVGGKTPTPATVIAFIESFREDLVSLDRRMSTEETGRREREERCRELRIRHCGKPDATFSELRPAVVKALESFTGLATKRNLPNCRKGTPGSPVVEIETPEVKQRREAMIAQMRRAQAADDL